MSFFTKLRNQFQRFMYGRAGVDMLSRDLNFLALFVMILGSALSISVVYIAGVLIFAVAIYRMFSRNINKRSSENMRYLSFRGKIVAWFKSKGRRVSDSKRYHYYKCPSCAQQLRVPKGKGKIQITCPNCKLQFIKKT